jgi:hypothetical protein
MSNAKESKVTLKSLQFIFGIAKGVKLGNLRKKIKELRKNDF